MRWLLLLILFFWGSRNFAQIPQWELVDSITGDFTGFATDNLKQIYTYRGSLLQKYDPAGKLLYTYSNQQFGDISSIDTRYALRPVLFYRDQGYLVVLDNTLSNSRGAIALFKHSLLSISLVATSVNNAYWFYNYSSFSLEKYTSQLESVLHTGNLGQLLQTKLNPDFLIERGGQVYLHNPPFGIYVFDQYGTYSRTIPVNPKHGFQVQQNQLIYLHNDSLFFFDLKFVGLMAIPLPAKDVKQARIRQDQLYLLKSTGIYIYRKPAK